MAIDLVETEINVVYTWDELTSLFTFSLLERGGPVIMATTLEEGKEKMKAALDCAMSVRNLQYFDDISFAKRLSASRSNKLSREKINFLEMQVA